MATLILAKEQQNILVQLKEKAQITLPYKIREILGLQKGDYLEAAIKGNMVTLTPKMVINKIPSISLSKQGKQMLKEAVGDFKKGRVKKFDNVYNLIEDLQS